MDPSKKKCQPKKAKKRSSKFQKSEEYGIDRPKRFLTAYNFFFMRERAAILNSAQNDGAGESSSSSAVVDPIVSAATTDGAAKPWTKKKGKRLHVKTHGKIQFGSLGKLVAAKWKSLPANERKEYEDLAKEDLERYLREVSVYKQKVAEIEKKAEQEEKDKSPTDTGSKESDEPQKLFQNTDKKEESVVPDQTKSENRAGSIQTENKVPQSPSQVEQKMKRLNIMPNKKKKQPSRREKETKVDTSSIEKERKIPSFHEFPKPTSSSADDDNKEKVIDGQNKLIPFNIQTNKLYDRDRHLSAIMEAYERLVQSKSSSEMVMISGSSGAGKSSLVQHIKKPITDMGAHFLCGKFDKFRQMEPLSAIIAALTNFLTTAANGENHLQIKSAVEKIEGFEANILAEAIPSFRHVFQNSSSSHNNERMGAREAQYRFKLSFRQFFRAISSLDKPLLLFLDDMQWADLLSLDLIESLMTDTENKYLFLICSYRDNEVNETHPLLTHLRKIENEGVIDITKINVGDLSRESVNDLVSDMIHTPPLLSQSLSDAVYRKTNGNVLFVLQFLRLIHEEGILHYEVNSGQWQWDTSMIDSKKIDDIAAGLMVQKIKQLPSDTQHSLKVMACIGSNCEEWILNSLRAGDSFYNVASAGLIASLDLAAKEGLVDHMGSTYTFAHDLIQFAAYSLIPENEKRNFHVWIGTKILVNEVVLPEKALFVAVGQLNKGVSVITDTSQRIQVASLNLQAGEKSMSLTAFVPAAYYLKIGISLLDERSWADNYDLCLRLYTLYAEAGYSTGGFDEMDRALGEIFVRAKSHLDKARAYFTSVNALVAQCKTSEALTFGVQALSQLGEPLPIHSDKKMVLMVEVAKAKQLLSEKTDDQLLTMKKMEDKHRIAAMKVMHSLTLTSFFADQELYALLALRIVQASLHHGICNESALGFAAYSSLMAADGGDIASAYRFGKLSLRLLKRSQAKECLPGVYVMVYTLVFSYFERLRESLQPLEHAYNVGMQCGNFNYAMVALAQHCVYKIYCGDNLAEIEKKMRISGKVMLEHKQVIALMMILPYRQACLNLMGRSDDPEQLTGDAMNQEQVMKDCQEKNHTRLIGVLYLLRAWLAYMFGNYESASRMVEKCKVASVVSPDGKSRILFIRGLVAFATAHKTDQVTWILIANNSIKELEKYAGLAPLNYQHMVLLLKAESAFLDGNTSDAARYYFDAIRIAGENGFVNDQAIAYERAGNFYSMQGNTDMATLHYHQAHNAYQTWGAHGKANHVRLKYSL